MQPWCFGQQRFATIFGEMSYAANHCRRGIDCGASCRHDRLGAMLAKRAQRDSERVRRPIMPTTSVGTAHPSRISSHDKRGHGAAASKCSRCLRVAALCATTLGACATQLRAEQPAGNAAPLKTIQQVDLVHFSHTDFGFTDHPVICRELYRRYLDIALDAALATHEQSAPAKVLLDRRNHRAGRRLVAGGIGGAPRAVPEGGAEPANWRSRPCP